MRTALNLELEEEATNREEALHPAPPPLTDSQFRRFLNKVGSRIPGNCTVSYCSTRFPNPHPTYLARIRLWIPPSISANVKRSSILQISSAFCNGTFNGFLNSVSSCIFGYIRRFLLF
jgi:hypothetical protein